MLRPGTPFVLSLCLFLSPLAAQEMHPATPPSPAFDQLKSLAGEWEGKAHSGAPATKVTYTVVSNGSVVMEHLLPAKESEMITMYSVEGDRIVVTHYCAMGNQPTMQTDPLKGAIGKYDFKFVRLGGAKSPDEPHMATLTLTILDNDHISQVWTFDDHGKSMTDTFTYTRVK